MMAADAVQMMSAELPCHRCGYDLRAHPPDGLCPECGASVAEARRFAAIPLRPAWRESDPRWRRRMLAGTWVLVLLPLMDTLRASRWASSVPVPSIFGYPHNDTLDNAFICWPGVYQTLVFCVGVVLLFSKERGRRARPLDWTRRWGVICSYVVLLLSAVPVLFIAALVLVGISALFISMPLKYQPGVTRFFVEVSSGYLRYGPNPKEITYDLLVMFSSITILLACLPLWDALRSSGPKRAAAILLAPLLLFSVMHSAQAAWYMLGFSPPPPADGSFLRAYFRPDLLVWYFAGQQTVWFVPPPRLSEFVVEATKWCIVLAIAVWLTIAQLATWRQGNKPTAT